MKVVICLILSDLKLLNGSLCVYILDIIYILFYLYILVSNIPIEYTHIVCIRKARIISACFLVPHVCLIDWDLVIWGQEL